MEVKRFDVFLVQLDPVRGSEIRKTRPCLIVSPNEMNDHLQTFIIAPMTSVLRNYPSRVQCVFQKIKGQVALDQLRAADESRFKKRLGSLDDLTAQKVCEVLTAMFEY